MPHSCHRLPFSCPWSKMVEVVACWLGRRARWPSARTRRTCWHCTDRQLCCSVDADATNSFSLWTWSSAWSSFYRRGLSLHEASLIVAPRRTSWTGISCRGTSIFAGPRCHRISLWPSRPNDDLVHQTAATSPFSWTDSLTAESCLCPVGPMRSNTSRRCLQDGSVSRCIWCFRSISWSTGEIWPSY